MQRAIILLSGGIDSTVCLALAQEEGLECVALSFDYSQRHHIELEAAKKIATYYDVRHHTIKLDPSPLVASKLVGNESEPGSAAAYVPARNTLFLAYAAAVAELEEASQIHYGPNALDYEAYSDCRPEYVSAFQNVLNFATRRAVEVSPPLLRTPLLHWDKAEIMREGARLQVPFALTHSCYAPDEFGNPCRSCLACTLRREGFALAGLPIS